MLLVFTFDNFESQVFIQIQRESYVPWEEVNGLEGEDLDLEAQEAYIKILEGVIVRIGSLLVQLGGLVTLIGEGPRELAVEALKMILEAIGKIDEVTEENVPELLDADYTDPEIVGANVLLPSYKLQEYTTWGDPYLYFVPEIDDQLLKITGSSLDLMLAELPSLVYFKDTDTFHGIMKES